MSSKLWDEIESMDDSENEKLALKIINGDAGIQASKVLAALNHLGVIEFGFQAESPDGKKKFKVTIEEV